MKSEKRKEKCLITILVKNQIELDTRSKFRVNTYYAILDNLAIQLNKRKI